MSDRKTGYSPLYVKNKRDVTNDVMFAYMHKKINILLSVLSIFFSFFYYDFNLNTQGFVLLSINWAPIKTCKFSRNAINAYLLYSCFIYRHIQPFFLYRNKLYIFPMLGLAKIRTNWEYTESKVWTIELRVHIYRLR